MLPGIALEDAEGQELVGVSDAGFYGKRLRVLDGLLMRFAEGQAHDVSRLVSLEQRGPEAPVEFAVEGRCDVGQLATKRR